MRLTLATALVLAWTAAAAAAEMATIVRETDARSGPGAVPPFSFTDKLRPGDVVEIQGEKSGFLIITPPKGAFSLVPKSAVRIVGNPGDKMGVVPAGAETMVGSSLGQQAEVIGSKLSPGAIVKIFDEVQLAGPAGPVSYYRIEPAGEVRYIPPEAVQRRAPAVETTRIPPTNVAPAPLNPAISGDVEALRRQADQAYRKAETTGDWNDAWRLYQELAKTSHADVRWEALNRLEFIRLRARNPALTPSQPIVPATYKPNPNSPYIPAQPLPPPQPVAPRYNSGYVYSQDRGAPTFVPTANANPTKPTANPATKPATPTTTLTGHTPGPGVLRRAHSTDQGRPLYYLEDRNGLLKCYVLPAGSINLEPLVGRVVQIAGSVPVYHSQLRADYMSATQATLVE
jgi:hypothetical protein